MLGRSSIRGHAEQRLEHTGMPKRPVVAMSAQYVQQLIQTFRIQARISQASLNCSCAYGPLWYLPRSDQSGLVHASSQYFPVTSVSAAISLAAHRHRRSLDVLYTGLLRRLSIHPQSGLSSSNPWADQPVLSTPVAQDIYSSIPVSVGGLSKQQAPFDHAPKRETTTCRMYETHRTGFYLQGVSIRSPSASRVDNGRGNQFQVTYHNQLSQAPRTSSSIRQ